MESTGQKGRIHMSEETADLLIQSGKQHLLRLREDKVTAKGKGEMVTFWLALGAEFDESEEESDDDALLSPISGGVESIGEETTDREEEDTIGRMPPPVSMSGMANRLSGARKRESKVTRLIDWNVEILSQLLKQVIVRRNALGLQSPSDETVPWNRPEGQTVLEEVREIITLPQFDAEAAKKQEDPEKMVLDPAVKDQLHEYVSTLAAMYRDNPFHNYEHARSVRAPLERSSC
jgi:hypothetical protein